MMDTEALWQAIAAYGNARWRGISHDHDAADHLAEIKHLLNEAEKEHKSLLAENERLVDEVAELKAAYESQFKELHELKAELEDAKQAARTWENEAERRSDRYTKCAAELERIKALEPVAWRSSMGHGVTLKESITDEQKALVWDGKPMWQPLYALWSKT